MNIEVLDIGSDCFIFGDKGEVIHCKVISFKMFVNEKTKDIIYKIKADDNKYYEKITKEIYTKQQIINKINENYVIETEFVNQF